MAAFCPRVLDLASDKCVDRGIPKVSNVERKPSRPSMDKTHQRATGAASCNGGAAADATGRTSSLMYGTGPHKGNCSFISMTAVSPVPDTRTFCSGISLTVDADT